MGQCGRRFLTTYFTLVIKNKKVREKFFLLSYGADEQIGYFVSACAVSIYTIIYIFLMEF